MKQSNLAEKIIVMSMEGIYMGISSVIRIFIDLIQRLLFRTSAFAGCGQSNNVLLRFVETADFDKNNLADPEATSERQSNLTILFPNSKSDFTEGKSSPLFAGFLPNNISVLCRYWCSNKFDCIIVL